MHIEIWWGDPTERDHWEDPDVDESIYINMNLQEVGWGGINWIDVAEDRDRWRGLVNAVMNLRVP